MNSSNREHVDCTHLLSLYFLNETQLSVQQHFEVTDCLFWSIVHDEVLWKLSIFTVLLLFAFSLIVNVYLLQGLKHSEALSWNPRYKLLKNLIASDLLLTLNIGLPSLYCLLYRRTISFSYRCVAQYFMGALAIINSLFTVTSMALERFVYICYGIHYLGIMTSGRTCCYLMLIWFLAVIGAGTSTFLMLMSGANFGRITAGFVCEPEVVQAQLEQPEYFETFNKIFILSLLLLCLLTFLFSYNRMYQEAQQMQQPFQQDNARARCTISFYFAIFLLQLFPSTIKLISLFGMDVDSQIYMIMLVLVPPCVNPLAYGIKNEEVRQTLKCLCMWRKLKELFSW